MTRGLAWKAASQIVLQGTRTVAAIVFARLLVPEEYGLAMMAVVVSSLVLIFSDLALGAALIHQENLTEADRSTAFWTSVGAGAVFTAAGIALSWPVASFYGEPRVQPLFAAISVSFLLTALGTTHSTLLSREMNFKSLELRLMAGVVVGATAGVLVAALGYGPWALIAQQLAATVVSTVLLWVSVPWRPRFTYSLASLRSLGAFGANVFGSRVLFYASRNADSLLIGRFLGPAALGAYSIAYNIMLIPFSRIAGPLQEVLFPAFSRIQGDVERMGAIWLRVIRVVAAVSMPAMLGLTVVASEFVTVVLGDRWSAAVPVLQVLAWVGFVQSVVRLNSSVLQARDRTGVLLRWSLLITSANIVAFAVGLSWGIVGVAVAYAVSNSLLQPVNLWQTARTVDRTLLDVLRSISGVTQAVVAMLAVLVPLRLLLVAEELPAAVRLVVLVAVGAAVYAATLAWREPELIREFARLRRRSPAAAAPATA